ncbi:phosphotransferase family protein [Streptomyces sp. NPDC102364]|uniref:phosphotransferase family protein n=1 Tax=Streptomyces sp. NPDC102364 TaxID=3366161 RepID=UPI0037FBC4D4
MSPPRHQGNPKPLAHWIARRLARNPSREVAKGHHNTNVILPLLPLAVALGVRWLRDNKDDLRELADKQSGGLRRLARLHVKYRTPLKAVEVVPRLWRPESLVLRALEGNLDQVPRSLGDFGDWSLHSYRVGQPLSKEVPEGKVGEARLRAFAQFFAALAGCDVLDRLELPDEYSRTAASSTDGFMKWLADFARSKVCAANQSRFGRLFGDVGVPEDAIGMFLENLPLLKPRPLTLLHTDVHRANVIVGKDDQGDEQLCIIDWELALYGDPLHDLATHLVRMRYDGEEYKKMIEYWGDAMSEAGFQAMTRDFERDLGHYIDFEHVQSVYADVMRAALDLPAEPTPAELAAVAARVHAAVLRARTALRLTGDFPGEQEDQEHLRNWLLANAVAGEVDEKGFADAG